LMAHSLEGRACIQRFISMRSRVIVCCDDMQSCLCSLTLHGEELFQSSPDLGVGRYFYARRFFRRSDTVSILARLGSRALRCIL
jgi:hypothetical protein